MPTTDPGEREKMRPVSASNPCPVCKKPDWCLVAPDGSAAICQRVESAKRCGDAGWLHRLAEPAPTRPPAPTKKPTAPKDWQALAAKFTTNLDADRRLKLAAKLGLPVGALDALPRLGFNPDDSAGACFTFPEFDAAGNVVGLLRRFCDGSKKAMHGSKRGLTLPTGWRDRPGPVFVVEGPTDAAALTAAGLAAVGRPSNTGGVGMLADLLRDLDPGRAIVVGENDQTATGWPGRDGALTVARGVSAALRCSIRWALPPADAKDVRDWLTADARAAVPWGERGADLRDHLAGAAAAVDPPDEPSAGSGAPTPPDEPNDGPPAPARAPETVPAAPVRRMTAPPWPDALDREAFHGLTGKFVAALEPATEADPAALLVQFLVGVGNAVGRTAHAVVEGDRHYCNEFAVLVGRSAKGRKGISLGRVKTALSRADPEWAGNRIVSGLSSGEGLIWQVRDPIDKQEAVRERGQPVKYETVTADEGVTDKRLLVTEPEFAGVLKQTERHGNTLSPVVRCAWDSGELRSLTKTSPAKATGAHISLIGHITSDELRRLLSATEIANGFANRFLWVCVKRSKLLPEGGTPDLGAVAAVECELAGVLAFARGAGEIKRDDEARDVWRDVYPTLSAERHGLAGSLLGRAEAHVLRLSVLYAVLDTSNTVKADHLCAALAVWKYCETSVLHLFGTSTGNLTADEIMLHLRNSAKGATRTEIRELVGKNLPVDKIADALAVLKDMGLAQPEHRDTAGRPSEVWTATNSGGVTRG